MRVLSIDVGIKNLAFCLFEKLPETNQFKVIKWDIINLTDDQCLKCSLCNNPAKFKKNNTCFCQKHSKKQQYLIPTKNQKPSVINKHKLINLYEIADGYNIQYDSKIKKVDLIALINEHIHTTYFDMIENKNSNEIDLCTIGENLKTKFNDLFKDIHNMDHVIIENQIGPIAVRMKTIQGMIVQYFIMSHVTVKNIEFVSAANKLKDCDAKEKEQYKDRKKLGIHKCLGILSEDGRFHEHIEHFNTHKKKDDLSDSFLQGLWFINIKNL
jgi:hypothetical protein